MKYNLKKLFDSVRTVQSQQPNVEPHTLEFKEFLGVQSK